MEVNGALAQLYTWDEPLASSILSLSSMELGMNFPMAAVKHPFRPAITQDPAPTPRGTDQSQVATGLMGGDELLRPGRRVIHRGAAFPVPRRGRRRKEESGERKVGEGGSYFICPTDRVPARDNRIALRILVARFPGAQRPRLLSVRRC